MTTTKPKATPKSIAKNVANPLDGIVKLAIKRDWRFSMRGGVVILDKRGSGDN